jgi:hypothetical protein
MTTRSRPLACLSGAVAATALAATGASAQCVFTPPLTTQTQCVTAIAIPGNPLRSFDISFVNPDRAQFYFADRSNAAIQVIHTGSLMWQRSLGGFVGIKLNAAGTAVNNNISGPDGVASHGRWVYGGDGDSTLKVFDLDGNPATALKQSVWTGGSTRVDEMALTTDGTLLIAANNAEDPPFATLFNANGDGPKSNVSIITKITVDPTIIPAGAGLSLEQPSWDPGTSRFYTSIPVIANNPPGCNYGQMPGAITCDGGLLVVDPATVTKPTATYGTFNTTTKTGVIALHGCGPNGSTVGPNENILLGCTPQNNPSNTITLVINAVSRVQTPVNGITGSDEVWYNAGDNRYYLGASRACGLAGGCPAGGAALGVVDAGTNLFIEKVPQSSNSHSVAADEKRNLIFVPQVGAASVVGSGGDTTSVGAGICGTNNGCVAVFQHNGRGARGLAGN